MIIIPMAGQSRRFHEAGYTRPKYELPLNGESLFACCTRSFEHYFHTERFVFVHRNDFGAAEFIAAECDRLGIADVVSVGLDGPTRGQAETVLLGLESAGHTGNEAIVIFNIDTIRPRYVFPGIADGSDGYLEVFAGEGTHWSFVQPAAAFGSRVARTTEKQRISSLCCTGLYYFARSADFAAVCRAALDDIDAYREQWGELYIAPMYNSLIGAGKRIVYHETGAGQVHFAGTPSEYHALVDARRGPF
jgi:hypothetical protein